MKTKKPTTAKRHIAVNLPEVLYKRVESHCRAIGIAAHEFVTEAVSDKLASIHKEKRKKQRL